MEPISRKSFNCCAIETAKIWAQRSEDVYKKVGCAVLNREGRLISVGYNGLSPNQKTKNSFWGDREKRRKYIIHAEMNALSCISRADKPYLLASTLLPCSACAINIASYGIKKVLYLEDYHLDQGAMEIFSFYKIKLIKYE